MSGARTAVVLIGDADDCNGCYARLNHHARSRGQGNTHTHTHKWFLERKTLLLSLICAVLWVGAIENKDVLCYDGGTGQWRYSCRYRSTAVCDECVYVCECVCELAQSQLYGGGVVSVWGNCNRE